MSSRSRVRSKRAGALARALALFLAVELCACGQTEAASAGSRVSGRMQPQNLPNLPFSALSRLYNTAAGGASATDVGCCFAGDQSSCTLDWSGDCSRSACF